MLVVEWDLRDFQHNKLPHKPTKKLGISTFDISVGDALKEMLSIFLQEMRFGRNAINFLRGNEIHGDADRK